MISKQPRLDSGIDASASAGSAWFRRGTLDINEPLAKPARASESDGRKNPRCGPRQGEKRALRRRAIGRIWSRHREPLYLNYLHVTQHNTPDGGIPTIGLPGYSAPTPAPRR
jgi:catecholate siderophore receptor